MDPKMIGGRIAQARKRMDLSQAQLGEQLFISPQAVGKWERGESLPDIVMLGRLAKILGVDLNYFSEDPRSEEAERTVAGPSVKRAVDVPSGEQGSKLNWDMSRGNWVDADFSGLKDLHEKFGSSNMKNCKFIGSDLSGLVLSGNNVDGCDFSNSDIGNSRIQSSNMANDVFTGCSLKGTEFFKSHLQGCNFSGADLTGAIIRSCGFEKNIMTDAVLVRTAFKASGLANMVFEGTLEDCSFEDCDFSKVTFRDSTLINTFFKGGNLKRIKFIACQVDRMTYEFLKNGKADLTGITVVTP
jgi:uncharacterized protein YjbI with pentapeptide repeats